MTKLDKITLLFSPSKSVLVLTGCDLWSRFAVHPSSLELVEVPPDVEPVGGDHVGLPLDQELRLLPRDVRHRREDVRKVRARTLDAVPEGKCSEKMLKYLTEYQILAKVEMHDLV